MVALEIKTNQSGQRLDKFLAKFLPKAPVSFLYKMLRKKNITLNDKKAEGKEILQLQDRVTLWLADETILKFGGYMPGADEKAQKAKGQINAGPAQAAHMGDTCREGLYYQAYEKLTGVSVIYEDAHVLILNKPAGLLTQQANAGDTSLNEWMIGYLLQSGAMDAEELRLFRPSVCNRLDRNTSGLVLCGKSLPGSQALSELIRSRRVRKFYRTICVGELRADSPDPKERDSVRTGLHAREEEQSLRGIQTQNGGQPPDCMRLEGYLCKDPHTNRVSISDRGPGEYIHTVCRPVRYFSVSADALYAPLCFTELEVELITGKPHQIRAHLSSIGHPLAGDTKYGDFRINQMFKQRFNLRWQLLHACRVEFPALEGTLETLSGKSIHAPLPPCYETILTGLSRLESAL